ncbi:FixH family protein [Brumimicrobium mesophilum]|uniref:FixH family protein n=1 Tax=Brumimicrobium mesophilum TaxID=392717 RepID=UPI000D142EFC|nr:FixH family protein [Brumimicrobium mesophilum]
MKKIFLLSLMSAFLFVACKKDKDETEESNPGVTNPSSEYKLIEKDTTDNDLIVELYAENETLEMGYTPVYVKVENLNGDLVENAMVSFMPMMDMGMMQHTTPTVQPIYNSTSGYYEGVIVFVMSSSQGAWDIEIMVDGEAATMDLNVLGAPAGEKHVGSYVGTNGDSYFVSIVKPLDWSVGMNDVSFMVHKRESMMSFPVVEGLTIAMDPQMTSMGHGSPNNISPVSVGDGFYEGEVNFTMTGDWRLNLDLIDAGDTIVNANIDVLF